MPKHKHQASDPHGLTPQQRLFVQFFCVFWQGKRAAIEAKYSEKTAASQASDLLNKPNVREAIEAEKKKLAAEAAHRRERIRAELDRIVFADLAEAFDESGRLKHIRKIPEHLRRAIASVKHLDDGTVEVKLWDKLGATKLVAQLDGLLVEKHEVEHKGKLEQLLLLAQKVREHRRKAKGAAK